MLLFQGLDNATGKEENEGFMPLHKTFQLRV